MLRFLVVSSCTAEKAYSPERQLQIEDFRHPETLLSRERELAPYALPAAEMYTGDQHRWVMEGINLLRGAFGRGVVDLYILSAGYGLIPEDRIIVPYNVTFSEMTSAQLREWAAFLRVRERTHEVIRDYPLVLFLLGDRYLKALGLPLEVRRGQKLLFLSSGSAAKGMATHEGHSALAVGPREATEFGCALVGLKGLLFRHLASVVVEMGLAVLLEVAHCPELWLELVGRYRKRTPVARAEQLRFPLPEVKARKEVRSPAQKGGPAVLVPSSEVAKNFGLHPVRYFIPEWDDRVDPTYDFLADAGRPGRDPYQDDVYAHEIFDPPNYDGILVSRVKLEENQTKKELAGQMGIHRFIRIGDRPVMGDCGAFGYVKDEVPRFTTAETLEYYQRLGFDYGVSVDHLIVGDYASDPVERQRRFRITQQNAEEFLRRHREGKYTFEPIGVAQGWDEDSYREAVANLIAMGYRYVALGGLARTPTTRIVSILRAVAPLVPEYLQVHLFGVARLEALETFIRLGVTSFDSASYLRRAWLGAGSNYFSLDGRKFTAIRVPPVDGRGLRIRRLVEEGNGDYETFRQLEREALMALRAYDRGEMGLEETLSYVLRYDRVLGDGRDRHADLYRQVLEERPWQKCDCRICREIGIEIIIFRGNNRNRRRGFHNTYVFYQLFQQVLKRMNLRTGY